MKITNAKQMPRLFYGLHMVTGVAEYDLKDGQKERIFIGDETIDKMNPGFQGLPVYVHHVDDVDMQTLQEEADGYVVRSFYNECDGKHWAEFMIVSDEAHESISKGWKLSNAYRIKQSAGGGSWHNVPYHSEVKMGEYEHLAIVPNPRYEESIILTPEQFKEYNSGKEKFRKQIANSKEKSSMFNLFKPKVKLENSEEVLSSVVALSDGTEKTLKDLVLEAQERVTNEKKEKEAALEAAKKVENMVQYASADSKVKVGEEEMTVNELVSKYTEMKSSKNAEGSDEEKKKKAKEEAEGKDEFVRGDDKAELEKKNAEEEAKKKAEEEEKSKKNSQETFERIANAHKSAEVDKVVETSSDQLARGKTRYGSNK